MKGRLDVVIPVLNEERRLPQAVPRLVGFLRQHVVDRPFRVVVASNGSTDGTDEIAREMEREYREVRLFSMGERGRGRALRTVWLASDAEIVSYMDVDLSADLAAFPAVIEHIDRGAAIAIGSRHAKSSRVERGWKRDVVSRGYNVVVKLTFGVKFSDAQCGFKAIRTEVARVLLPLVEDNGWFFDTELLILAESLGYPIGEVGLHWVENTDSKVDIAGTAWADLRGLARLRTGGLARAQAAARQADGPGSPAGRTR
jgi:glycosyltransferase involved in cell wall biosynthesis